MPRAKQLTHPRGRAVPVGLMSHVEPLNVTSSIRPARTAISSRRFISGASHIPWKKCGDAFCRTRASRFPRDTALERFLRAPYATLMTPRRFLPPFRRLSASMRQYKRGCVCRPPDPHLFPTVFGRPRYQPGKFRLTKEYEKLNSPRAHWELLAFISCGVWYHSTPEIYNKYRSSNFIADVKFPLLD